MAWLCTFVMYMPAGLWTSIGSSTLGAGTNEASDGDGTGPAPKAGAAEALEATKSLAKLEAIADPA